MLEGFLTVFWEKKSISSRFLKARATSSRLRISSIVWTSRHATARMKLSSEIQNTRELYYLERILYGVAKAITEHISLGDKYYQVKKIYSISVLYFDIGKGSDYLYHGQDTFIGVHTGDQLQVNVKERGPSCNVCLRKYSLNTFLSA